MIRKTETAKPPRRLDSKRDGSYTLEVLRMMVAQTKRCSHRGCFKPALHALGWGFGAGLTQWFCGAHFAPALARLAGLVRAAGLAA
jgi:hypothetical protein